MDVIPLTKHRILCLFRDNKVKIISLSDLDNSKDISKILANDSLFESCTISPGGYAASFNNSIDIPATLLYEAGFEIPVSVEDFKVIVKKNILTTAEACKLLKCSRQNVAYMVSQQQLIPLKKDDTSSLYLKGELLQTKW